MSSVHVCSKSSPHLLARILYCHHVDSKWLRLILILTFSWTLWEIFNFFASDFLDLRFFHSLFLLGCGFKFMVTCRSLLNSFFASFVSSLAYLIDFFCVHSRNSSFEAIKKFHSMRLWSAVKKKKKNFRRAWHEATQPRSFILAREKKCIGECQWFLEMLWIFVD